MNRILEAIRPILTEDKVRLGSKRDGGYVVNRRAIMGANLLSLGVNDNWSFEEDYLGTASGKVRMYDGSVSKGYFFKEFMKQAFEVFSLMFLYSFLIRPYVVVFKWRDIRRTFRNFWRFREFTSRPDVEFQSRFVSKDAPDSESLDRVLEDFQSGENGLFLKIDIEGDEYSLCDDILKHSPRIGGLVIEFHGLDSMYDSFMSCIDKLKGAFYITHIHANNYTNYSQIIGTMAVYEITFLRKDLLTEEPRYFQSGVYNDRLLDYSNNPDIPDYVIDYP